MKPWHIAVTGMTAGGALGAFVVVVALRPHTLPEPAPLHREPRKTAEPQLPDEMRKTIGEAHFGGMWIEWLDKYTPRLKVGVTDRRAAAAVRELAAKYGEEAVDVVRVPYTMAAIETCHAWLSARTGEANYRAPLPMGAGIGGRVEPGLGVSVKLPKNATKAQRDLVAAAQQRCGRGMLKVEPGHVLVSPLPGPPPRVTPPRAPARAPAATSRRPPRPAASTGG